MYGCVKGCLVLIPFRLPQISCFTLSLKSFSSESDNCPDVGIGPLLQLPHWPRAGPVLLTLLFPPCFLPLTEFCMGLYILFLWSGTPVHSQLGFCMHFCVWTCIPDVSVERDVLHTHLLLCHLVLPQEDFFRWRVRLDVPRMHSKILCLIWSVPHFPAISLSNKIIPLLLSLCFRNGMSFICDN